MLLVIAALVINGLGLLDPAPAEATPAPDTAVTPVPQETAAAEPTPTFTALDDGEHQGDTERRRHGDEQLRGCYAAADKGEAQNVVLSDEAVASMVSALGAAGYSAVDYGNCNMQNPEALAAFGEAVSAGNDAQAGYFVVHPDGLVHEEVLIYRSGAASVVTVSMQWDDKTRPRYTPPDSTALRAYATPKTAGSYTAAAAPNANANKYSMVRVKTYDADRRALCRRYLTPVGYSENNLFTSSWNTGNWGELDFNSLYAKFTACHYGAGAADL